MTNFVLRYHPCGSHKLKIGECFSLEVVNISVSAGNVFVNDTNVSTKLVDINALSVDIHL